MLKINFLSLGYVGRSIYAQDIKLNGQTILPYAYLAASMVTIIEDNDEGQEGPIDVVALVPTWLIRAKVEDYKKEQTEADAATVNDILAMAASN